MLTSSARRFLPIPIDQIAFVAVATFESAHSECDVGLCRDRGSYRSRFASCGRISGSGGSLLLSAHARGWGGRSKIEWTKETQERPEHKREDERSSCPGAVLVFLSGLLGVSGTGRLVLRSRITVTLVQHSCSQIPIEARREVGDWRG